MRFHLTYSGTLHGSNTGSPRANHKHEIRKVFHRQLKQLWGATWLKHQTYGLWDKDQTIPERTPLNEALSAIYKRDNYRFVPLVRERISLHCSLDILFLRPDAPGSIVQSADIDNRLKTLFDALRMPANASELGKYEKPNEGEDPFYCLLEDDKLISRVSVTTDMLLEPITDLANDVRLMIDVQISPYNVTFGNIGFGGS